LHFLVTEPSAVGKNCEGITQKGFGTENIHLYERKSSQRCHGAPL